MTTMTSLPATAATRYLARAYADRMEAHALRQGMDAYSARLLADEAQSRYEEFEGYLSCWEAVLRRRADEAMTAIASIDGVVGVVLTGGLARGDAWPLSDIDLVPIYDDARRVAAEGQVKRRVVEVMRAWATEGGWLTHLDTTFAVTRDEVGRTVTADGIAARALLGDRWYGAIDKGDGARVAADPHGLVVPFVTWCTASMADLAVGRARLDYCWERAVAAEQGLRECLAVGDLVGATVRLTQAVQWLKAWGLTTWGERDTSQGRWGTRFARLAATHGRPELGTILDEVSGFDEAAVTQRLAAAPAWVVERHAWSMRARRQAGERVTRLQAARDVLRSEGLRELLMLEAPPYPAWLAIPTEPAPVEASADRLAEIRAEWSAEAASVSP